MALTTQAKIEQRLQWDITAEPDPVVAGLIAAATAHIEAHIGRKVESATYTDELHDPPLRGAVYLQYWPVTSVTTVEVEGVALAASEILFYPHGTLYRVSDSRVVSWQTSKRQAISVTYVGGYLAGTHVWELEHLGSICTEIVARAFRSGAASAAAPAGVGLGGIASVHLEGSDSVSYATTSGDTLTLGGGLTRFLFLLDEERREIDRYRGLMVA